MTIQVTQQDIEAGEKSRYLKCPIALAVTRSTGYQVGATYRTIDITKPGMERVDIPIPAEALFFIQQFDSGQPVKPFTFNLNIPLTQPTLPA